MILKSFIVQTLLSVKMATETFPGYKVDHIEFDLPISTYWDEESKCHGLEVSTDLKVGNIKFKITIGD